MALPLRVLNAFRFGHSLAAEVKPRKPGARAWVRVKPVLQSGETERRVRERWTLARRADGPYDGTISRYLVRYLELESWNPKVDFGYDLDYMLRDRTLQDESIELEDDASLEGWLSHHLADLSVLRHPTSVEYYFDL